MQTQCPDCGSTIAVASPTTDPAAPMPCDGCGSTVRPGVFLCPSCGVGLQVERHLLPANGGRGQCPACTLEIDVPALVSPEAVAGVGDATHDAGPAPVPTPAFDAPGATQRIDLASLQPELASMTPGAEGIPSALGQEAAIPETMAVGGQGQGDAAATNELQFGSLDDSLWDDDSPAHATDSGAGSSPTAAGLAQPPGASAAGAATAAAVATVPEMADAPIPVAAVPELTEEPLSLSPEPSSHQAPGEELVLDRGGKRRGRGTSVLLGMVIGGGVAAGVGYVAAFTGYWTPPTSPFAGLVPLSDLASGVAMLGTAGAVVGLILGSLLGGSRSR